ncbi:DUF4129 domain-containing protein [Intestinimonas sp. MSJ-38]|uniref:DUF4129 domain-containing protein n=1 Tax=Intestinimonas sp. MSJ-38 TaxID=2841532 RepID=UPI000E51825F|nr:DUF4129 domain-containing protein [Intestinimonas sp. MSJ-38]MBU5431530.1 DUF4129 domain-containing protein [Intestinimonas sp. MSJ-38]RHT74803.1 DUF4129 domain-containing protein [Ruminococcaceae bacterium AM28-23LB]
MNLLFCFKMVSEFSFYFILGNYFATQMKGNGIPLPLCLLPPLAVALCRLLNSRKNKWERLPLLLCLIGLFFLHTAPDIGVYLFGCLYGTLLVFRKIYYHSYDMALENFNRCSIILAIAMPLLALASGGVAALTDAVPLAFLFLASSVLQTRMLRHSPATLENKKFLLRNLAVLVFLAVLTLISATEPAQILYRNGLALFYNLVVVNFARLLLLAVTVIAYVFRFIYSLFHGKFEPTLPTEGEVELAFGLKGMEYEQVTQTPLWVQRIIIGALILALMAIIGYVLWRMTRRRYSDDRQAEMEDTREEWREPKGPRREIFTPRDPRRAVRHYYARFLRDAHKRGIHITPESTTREILQRCLSCYEQEGLTLLRQVYLSARYDPSPVDRVLVKQAREYYNKTVRSARNHKEEIK